MVSHIERDDVVDRGDMSGVTIENALMPRKTVSRRQMHLHAQKQHSPVDFGCEFPAATTHPLDGFAEIERRLEKGRRRLR